MQNNDQNQKNPARLGVCGAEHGIQVPQQEKDRPSKPDTHKDPVQQRERAPADQRDGDPDEVRVAVECPALNQIRAGAAEPPQHRPERDRDHACVAVHQARRAGEQPKVILKVLRIAPRQVLRHSARKEQDDHHCGRDPERAVQVRVAV